MKERKTYKITVTYFICAKSQDRAEEELWWCGAEAGKIMKTEEIGCTDELDVDTLLWLENEGGIMHAHHDIQPSDQGGFEQPF